MEAWLGPGNSDVIALRLKGVPGAGKSVLVSRVIAETRPVKPLIFFYCKYEDRSQNSLIAVLKGFLAQLIHLNPEVLSHIHEEVSKSSELTLETQKFLEKLVECALETSEALLIIIDGLDKCDKKEKKKIMSWFRSLLEAEDCPGRLRLLVVSQDEGDIRQYLAKRPSISLSDALQHQNAIRAYASRKAAKIRAKLELPVSTEKAIIELVTNHSKGMFLFAPLVLKHLKCQITLKQLEQELNPSRFPTELYEIYDRIYQRIESNGAQQREAAEKIIAWVVCCKRALQWHEIQSMFAIDLEMSTVDFQGIVEQNYSARAPYSKNHTCSINLDLTWNLESICMPLICELQPHVFNACAFTALMASIKVELGSNSDSLDRLRSLIDKFIDCHLRSQQGADKTKVTPPFPNHSEDTNYAVAQIKFLQRAWKSFTSSEKSHEEQDIFQFRGQLERRRFIFENTITDIPSGDPRRLELSMFYGDPGGWFKCSKMQCFAFYNGFPSLATRDNHAIKHQTEQLLQNQIQSEMVHELELDPRITTELLPHQKRALYFILQRERGVATGDLSLWKIEGTQDRRYYRYSLHNVRIAECPEDNRGGILADEMGLKPESSLISAIVTSLEDAKAYSKSYSTNGGHK
ncbi:hypothetical protein EG329_008618 [Mollisiaceae sp. DMI_Dod_QoI]|nr:hypothetical protein EG329_008618 [Helotiales sp. DMI_Dod_QoI]